MSCSSMAPTMPSSLPPIVLSFPGTDPTGGAGTQADLLTLSSMGCHALTVVTAITVQDTAGVEDVLPIDADWVSDQARVLLEDMPVAAFKIGMVGSVENCAAIAEVVSEAVRRAWLAPCWNKTWQQGKMRRYFNPNQAPGHDSSIDQHRIQDLDVPHLRLPLRRGRRRSRRGHRPGHALGGRAH